MPTRTAYQHGTPSWVDLSTTDREGARAFYGDLFGWTGEPEKDPRAFGYMVFMLGEHAVAGCMQMVDDMPGPCWGTYVTVENVDDTVTTARESGGVICMEGCDVLEAGRMAVITDPTGAVFSIWQPGDHIGAEIVNEHGAFCWSELTTRDTEAAKQFYGKIFSWGAVQVGDPDANPPYDYHGWTLGGSTDFSDMVGGMIRMDENWPAEIPPHWMTYFAVDDCDASAAKVTELGGTVCVPPTNIPPGRFSVVQDPQGATFTIIHMFEQPDRSDEAAEGVASRSGV